MPAYIGGNQPDAYHLASPKKIFMRTALPAELAAWIFPLQAGKYKSTSVLPAVQVQPDDCHQVVLPINLRVTVDKWTIKQAII